MADSNLNIVSGAVAGNSLDTLIKTTLHDHLPYSLPLYRRCRYERHSPSSAEVWIATAANSTELANDIVGLTKLSSSYPWLAAYINLANPGQTQIWLYASWENPEFSHTGNYLLRQSLIIHLLSHLRVNHIPQLPVQPPQAYTSLESTNKILSKPYKRTKVLFGSLHECHHHLLTDTSISGGIVQVTRKDTSYLKYLIRNTDPIDQDRQLPPDFRTGPISDAKDMHTIISSTTIPRTIETIQNLPKFGIFHDQTLISWGLISKDGSLASLYTIPEYRGRGLSKIVARGLMGLLAQEDAAGWGHVDVSESNMASRRVVKGIGGYVGWRVGWIEVDVGED